MWNEQGRNKVWSLRHLRTDGQTMHCCSLIVLVSALVWCQPTGGARIVVDRKETIESPDSQNHEGMRSSDERNVPRGVFGSDEGDGARDHSLAGGPVNDRSPRNDRAPRQDNTVMEDRTEKNFGSRGLIRKWAFNRPWTYRDCDWCPWAYKKDIAAKTRTEPDQH